MRPSQYHYIKRIWTRNHHKKNQKGCFGNFFTTVIVLSVCVTLISGAFPVLAAFIMALLLAAFISFTIKIMKTVTLYLRKRHDRQKELVNYEGNYPLDRTSGQHIVNCENELSESEAQLFANPTSSKLSPQNTESNAFAVPNSVKSTYNPYEHAKTIAERKLSMAQEAIDVLNNTLDEKEFYLSLNRATKLLYDLSMNENLYDLDISPSEELKKLLGKREELISLFEERKNFDLENFMKECNEYVSSRDDRGIQLESSRHDNVKRSS